MTAASLSAPAVRRPRILCVDDEPRVLESLALTLRRRYEVDTAMDGVQAMDRIRSEEPYAVILSDMRMPVMDGATFLRHARELVPDAVRLLLTGHADVASVAAAVNEGRIFRYLTKPCPPPELIAAVEAAVDQHRLLTSERVLLEKTLHGSIKLLTDMLILCNPLAFGRANRTKVLVGELASQIGWRQRWQVEVASMLSQLFTVTLKPETVEKLYFGQALDSAEVAAADRGRQITIELLSNIPRVELVNEILARYFDVAGTRRTPLTLQEESIAERGAALLRVAVDFDLLEAQGRTARDAIDVMRMTTATYSPELIAALEDLRAAGGAARELRDLRIGALQVGMVFADDVKLVTGALLIPRGQEVTEGVIERLARLRPGACPEPLRMVMPDQAALTEGVTAPAAD